MSASNNDVDGSHDETLSADALTVSKSLVRRIRFRHIGTLVLLLVVGLPLLAQLPKVRVDNDVGHWLQSDDESTRLLDWFVGKFPVKERLFVSWTGNSLDDPRLETFVEALRAQPDRFADVVNPFEIVDRMSNRDVTMDEAVGRLRGYLVGPRDEATQSERAGLLVLVTEEASSKPRALIAAIRQCAESAGIAADSLSIAGSVMVRAQLNSEVDRVAYNPEAPAWRIDKRSTLLASVIFGLVVTLVILRNIRQSLLVLSVAFASTLLTLSFLPVTGGALNIVLLVMPTLVFVITVSAAIHVTNYWKMSGDHHSVIGTDTAQKTAFGPCLLASTTTAIGLSSLAISPLSPVAQFGFYSAIGSCLSFVLTVGVLPALLWLIFRKVRPAKTSISTFFGRLTAFVAKRRGRVIFLAAVLLAVSAIGLRNLKTESRIVRYFPLHSQIVRGYEDIESNIAGIAPIEALVVLNADAQERLRFRNRVELIRDASVAINDVKSVTGTLCLADFLPQDPEPPSSASFLQKSRWHRVGREMERSLKEDEDAEESIFFRPIEQTDDFAADGDELWGITAHVRLLPDDVDFARVISDIETAAETALGPDVGAKVYVTGMVPQFLRVQQAVLDSLVLSFVTAFGVIALVLTIYLRDPIAAALLMVPNLLPVAAVFGMLGWLGISVDIGTMLTASVALGIAVDDSVHILVAFRRRVRDGESLNDAVTHALTHAGFALVQTSVVLASGLVVLGSADMRLISQFGLVMAALLIAALVADLIVLPAMLCGQLGRRISRGVMSTTHSPAEKVSAEKDDRMVPV